MKVIYIQFNQFWGEKRIPHRVTLSHPVRYSGSAKKNLVNEMERSFSNKSSWQF